MQVCALPNFEHRGDGKLIRPSALCANLRMVITGKSSLFWWCYWFLRSAFQDSCRALFLSTQKLVGHSNILCNQMTTCDSSLICKFDEDLLLAQLNAMDSNDINTIEKTNYFKNVEQLLKSFYDLNSKEDEKFDSDFAKALFKAVDVGHLKVLKWLKEQDLILLPTM